MWDVERETLVPIGAPSDLDNNFLAREGDLTMRFAAGFVVVVAVAAVVVVPSSPRRTAT